MHKTLLSLFAAATIAGCGSSSKGSGGTLDCAWLAGDNCWKTTASAALSCLPPADATGTLSADNATCTYATGQVVRNRSEIT